MNASPPPAPRGVVFDLDGTLVDSMPLVLRAVAHALEPFMAVPPPDEIYRRVAGPADRCMAELLGDDRHVPAAVRRLFEYAERHRHEVVLFEGALATIDRLRGAGMPVALWTGRDRESAGAILARTGLDRRFEWIVCGDDLDTHKPDPEGLHLLAERMAVPVDGLLLVGDAEVDVRGARAAGARALLIHHGRELSAEVRALEPDLAAEPAEAYARLAGWCGGR